ncbi:S-layer homology domain-containing protein [Paenibacillus sp. GYB003]|uniref:S-layer homology domain-containing protein n=1 Tax=Paenibacillus sp. GYB003 TaxID=2994392 RepID=UPI002F966CC2
MDDPIRSEDIAVMIDRALKLKASASDKTFTDEEAVSDYARDAVGGLQGAGLIQGCEDGSFRPTEQASRAQAAILIFSAWKIYLQAD